MKEKDLINGSIWHNIIDFSLPYLLSYFLQILYGLADLFIIGQFCGVDSITSVSIGSQIMHMFTVIIVGLAMGTTVVIARSVGARDHKTTALIIGNTITLFMFFSIIMSIGLLYGVDFIVHSISTPQEAVNNTISYLTVCFIGIPFIVAYNIIASIFRGMGDSKSPMYFIAIACVINIILDYVLIGFFKMDALGAALGTTLSQTISVIIAIIVIKQRKEGIRITKKDLKPQQRAMQAVLKIGIPVALQDGFIQVAFIIITIIANERGLNDAAAVGIVEKVIGILFLIPSAMLSTVSAISAQNLGAGKLNRAHQTLWNATYIAVGFGIIAVISIQFIAKQTIGLFTGEEQVIILGSQYLKGYVWDCIFAGIHFCFSGFFCACGLSILSFIHNSISIICVRIPCAYLASAKYADTLFPMGISSAAGSLISVFICIGFYLWMKKHYKYQF